MTTTTTLKAKGFRSGWQDSATRTATLTLNFGTLSTPTLSPTSGTYDTDQLVTMTADAGATIRYTTDGSTPSTSSPVYSAPVSAAAATTVKARAFRTDWTASGTRTETYAFKVATPTFSVESGTYAPGQTITIATVTPNATIRYTLDGSTPTTSDPVLASGAVITLGAFTVRTLAWRTGYTTSDLATATYDLNAALTSARVAGGGSHSLALREDGTVWGWGLNSGGQVGDGTTTQRKTPVMVEGLSGVMGVAAGQHHSLAVRQDGTVVAWGTNSNGQIGDGTTTARSWATAVSGLSTVLAVAAGANHSLALKTDGTVMAWGKNTNGQLGDGTTTQRTTPVSVSNLANVVAIAAGEAFSVAALADGTVWAWGLNTNGQLGDGTTTQRTTPVRSGPLTGITQVAAGRAHALARTGSGAVWAWGLNSQGQLGDNSTTQRTSPVAVSGLTAASIAAGWQHSVATQASGAVAAWGYNATGQLGDGTTTRRLTPITVPNLPSVDTVAGGETHSLALTPDDAVWTWGGNASGQLGDGTTTQQTSGIPVSGTQLTWGVVAPTATPAAGSFTATTTVTLATVTPGATIHYTTNGTEPTEADATFVAGTPIGVDGTLTITAKAWKTGLTPSPTSTLVYTLRPVTPTLTPAPTGTPFTSAQTVTLATPTSGAEIRYTLDGTTPTANSALYSSALTLATGTTVKALAFKSGWSASTEASGVYTFNYGTLATPVASPGGQQLTQATYVTLSADAGTIIWYTTDGTEPSLGSPGTSAQPTPVTLVIDAATTINAKATRADWTSSATLSESYSWGDAHPPTITAVVSPDPSTSGWHRTPVTITFRCADDQAVATCTPPQTVTEDGANQVVSGTATDQAGHQATTSATVSVDRTPPLLALSGAVEGQVVTTSAFTLTTTVSDALSGISEVTCQGQTRPVVNGAMACDVPLREGRNTLIVTATDQAGNTATLAPTIIYVPPTVTTLLVTPSSRTLLVGEGAPLTAQDGAGTAVSATWESADTDVATVDTNGFVTAVGAGSVDITAHSGSLTAQAHVTVVAGTSLPLGTAQWQAAPTPGFQTAQLIVAQPNVEGVALFALEADGAGTLRVRGFSRDGAERWAQSIGFAPNTPMQKTAGDALGGVLVTLPNAVVRVGFGAIGPSWAYVSSGALAAEVAQGADGTVYLPEMHGTVEWSGGTASRRGELVAVDGATGFVQWRRVLPSSAYTLTTTCPNQMGEHVTYGAWPGQPVVGTDGSVFVPVGEVTTTVDRTCAFLGYDHDGIPDPIYVDRDAIAIDKRVSVLQVTREGSEIWHPVTSVFDTGVSMWGESTVHERGVGIAALIPLEEGGLDVYHQRAEYNAVGELVVDSFRQPLGGAASPVPTLPWWTQVRGENGVGFLMDAENEQPVVRAFDLASHQALWAQPASEILLATTTGVAVKAAGDTLVQYGADGVVESTAAGAYQLHVAADEWAGVHSNQVTYGPDIHLVHASQAWAYQGGNAARSNAGQLACVPPPHPSFDALTRAVNFVTSPQFVEADGVHLPDVEAAIAEWNMAVRKYRPAVELTFSQTPVSNRVNVELRLNGDLQGAERGNTERGPDATAGQGTPWYIEYKPGFPTTAENNYWPLLIRHEVGHVLGLGNVAGECGPLDSVMVYDAGSGVWPNGGSRTLSKNDIKAIHRLYGSQP
ncbi:MAG: chitobiase/beta-hexosaminidase C-terminal domain-containing protein [Vicinamibacterales bacterium]